MRTDCAPHFWRRPTTFWSEERCLPEVQPRFVGSFCRHNLCPRQQYFLHRYGTRQGNSRQLGPSTDKGCGTEVPPRPKEWYRCTTTDLKVPHFCRVGQHPPPQQCFLGTFNTTPTPSGVLPKKSARPSKHPLEFEPCNPSDAMVRAYVCNTIPHTIDDEGLLLAGFA